MLRVRRSALVGGAISLEPLGLTQHLALSSLSSNTNIGCRVGQTIAIKCRKPYLGVSTLQSSLGFALLRCYSVAI